MRLILQTFTFKQDCWKPPVLLWRAGWCFFFFFFCFSIIDLNDCHFSSAEVYSVKPSARTQMIWLTLNDQHTTLLRQILSLMIRYDDSQPLPWLYMQECWITNKISTTVENWLERMKRWDHLLSSGCKCWIWHKACKAPTWKFWGSQWKTLSVLANIQKTFLKYKTTNQNQHISQRHVGLYCLCASCLFMHDDIQARTHAVTLSRAGWKANQKINCTKDPTKLYSPSSSSSSSLSLSFVVTLPSPFLTHVSA